MNLWVARGAGAQVEARIMSPVAAAYISPKTSGPVNGQVQDSTIGCAALTRGGVRVGKYQAMALFAGAGVDPPRFDGRPPGEAYTGREVASLLFEAAPVNYRREPTSFSAVYAPFIPYDPEDTLAVVEQGRVVRGVLDKKAIGAGSTGSIFHLIGREYGPQRALDMIFAAQQVSLRFLAAVGFTVGTADLVLSPPARAAVWAAVEAAELESRLITDQLTRGELVPRIGETLHQFYEELQIAALKVDETEVLRPVLGDIRPATNGLFRMIADGGKGGNPNLINIMAVIGPTKINGERIKPKLAFGRHDPYNARFTTDPGAHGWVRNCFIEGMSVVEYMKQNENGRFDLINKSLSTAGTGYFMRKGVMNNQSSIIDNHRRVTKDTQVVEFLYGEDGLDSRELERVAFPTVRLSDAALAEAAGLPADAALAGGPEEVAAARAAAAAAVAKIREDRDFFREAFGRVEAANFDQGVPADVLMPVNVGRIVEGVFIAARRAGAPPPPLTAAGLRGRIERVWDLCARLPYALVNEIQERRGAPVSPQKAAAAALLCMLVRAELSPRVLARLSDEQLAYVADAVRQRYSASLAEYGTAAGILAAQAISQFLTQYMLDSHHRSVGGGTNKAGLVRVNEIYGARPVADEQSPSMLLLLRPEALGEPAGAAAVAAGIANAMEYVTLRDFVRQFDTLLEPYFDAAPGAAAARYPPYAGDAAWAAEYARAHPLVRPPGDLTNWCFRFVLDKATLELKAVDLELIVGRLRRVHANSFFVVHTSEAVPEVVIRAWVRAAQFRRGAADEEHARALLEEALATPIRGVRGVMRAAVERVARHRVAEDGALVKDDRLAIRTVGTNLYGALLCPAVDPTCAISTSIGDTVKMYGIEAGRAKIVSETRALMGDGAPNLRHLLIYGDGMTRRGRVMSIERGSLAASEGNVFLDMAYGAPVGVVSDAALAGTRSKVYGVAGPQLLGSTPQVGTLYNGFVVDEAFVRANVQSVDSVLDAL